MSFATRISVSQEPKRFDANLQKIGFWATIALIAVLQIWLHHDVTDRFFVAIQDFEELEFAKTETMPDPWGAFTRPHQGFGYRPLGDLLRAGNVAMTAGDPGLLLLRTIVFHSLLIGMVIILGKIVTGSPLVGALIGLVWAFHPTHMSQLGVPMWGAGVGSMILPIMVLLAFMVEDRKPHPRLLVSILMLIALLTPWLYEGFLWIVPVFSCWIGLLVYRRYLAKSDLWLILLPIVSLVAYFIMRMSVHDLATQLLEAAPTSNYGLKPFGVIAQNIVMHQYATAMRLDHLFFIAPLVETVTLGGGNRGVLVSLGLGLGFAAFVYAGALFLLVRQGFKLMWRLLAMLVLYWTSVSIFMLVTDTTEMYVYLSSIFWYIFAIGVIAKLIGELFTSGSKRRIFAWMLAVLALVPGSVAGTQYRIGALEMKGALVADQVTSAREWAAESEGLPLTLILDCDIPTGFSIYGKTRFAWWGTGPFRRWALGQQGDSLNLFRAPDVVIGDILMLSGSVAFLTRGGEFIEDEVELTRLVEGCAR